MPSYSPNCAGTLAGSRRSHLCRKVLQPRHPFSVPTSPIFVDRHTWRYSCLLLLVYPSRRQELASSEEPSMVGACSGAWTKTPSVEGRAKISFHQRATRVRSRSSLFRPVSLFGVVTQGTDHQKRAVKSRLACCVATFVGFPFRVAQTLDAAPLQCMTK